MYICIYTYTSIYMHICIWNCVRDHIIHMKICVNMMVYVYVCMYIMYVYTTIYAYLHMELCEGPHNSYGNVHIWRYV